MIQFLESGAFRLFCYLLAALGAVLAARREHAIHNESPNPGRWHLFWLAIGSTLAALGVARGTPLSRTIAGLVKGQVRGAGLYELRGPYQLAILVALLPICGVVTVAALQRIPTDRRQEFLPGSVAMIAVVAFAFSRFVSLHQLDAVLDRRDLGGIRLGALLEVVLLAFVTGATSWSMARRRSGADECRPKAAADVG
jgi:hypothetical protein